MKKNEKKRKDKLMTIKIEFFINVIITMGYYLVFFFVIEYLFWQENFNFFYLFNCFENQEEKAHLFLTMISNYFLLLLYFYFQLSDYIHGYMLFSRGVINFIDTPQFQRLRDLKQLGTTFLIFPGNQWVVVKL